MGCLCSRFGPRLRARVADGPTPVRATGTDIILLRSTPQQKGEGSAQHSLGTEDYLSGYLSGYESGDDGEFSEAHLERAISTATDVSSGSGSQSYGPDQYAVPMRIPPSWNNGKSTPENGEESNTDPMVAVIDHDMLWILLKRSRRGSCNSWKRHLRVGHGCSPTQSACVQYRVLIPQTEKLRSHLAIHCLPWPDLYAGSTDQLTAFVKTVNLWLGLDVFDLRRVSNDEAKQLKDKVIKVIGVRAATLGRIAPEYFRLPTERACHRAAFENFVRTTMERKSRVVRCLFRGGSSDFVEVDPTTGQIREPAEAQPVLRHDAQASRSDPSEIRPEQTLAWPAHMFTTDPPGPRSEKIHTSEASQQTKTSVHSSPFQKVPKPSLEPPPMFNFNSARQKKQETESALAERVRTSTPGYGTLLTSDSLRSAQTRNGFDSAAVAQGRRQPSVTTFATPYYAGPKYSHVGSTSAIREDGRTRNIHSPVLGPTRSL